MQSILDAPDKFGVIPNIINDLPCGVALHAEDLSMLACNARFKELLGLPESLFQHGLPSLQKIVRFNAERGEYGTKDSEGFSQRLIERFLTEKSLSYQRERPNGVVLEIEVQWLQTGGFIALFKDITEQQQREKSLRESEALLRMIYDNSTVGIFTMNTEGVISHANNRLAQMFGIPVDQLVGSSYLELVHPLDRPLVRLNAVTTSLVHIERRYIRQNGEMFWGDLSVHPMPLPKTKLLQVVCVVSDITKRKSAEQALVERGRQLEVLNAELNKSIAELNHAREQLEQMSQHDTLTAVWNRKKIMEIAAQEIQRKRRYALPVSMIFMDIDHFKSINDTFGHAIGDDALQHFCSVANQCIRSTDFFGRWGGEEFVIITPNSGLMIALVLAERIRSSLIEHECPTVGRMTASFGVAEFLDCEDWEQWLSRTDVAMYKAKVTGRNRVVADGYGDGSDELLDPAFHRLVWHSSYDSGIESIDRGHKRLFECANGLLDAVVARKSVADIAPLVEVLTDDLIQHFKDEGVVLRGWSVEAAQEHAAIHSDLLSRLTVMLDKYKANQLLLWELFNFIAYDVIAKHFLSEDKKLFERLAPPEEVNGPRTCSSPGAPSGY